MQVPGFSLHRELALLSEGGIANAEVLGSATREAARVLRRSEELGTLEAGKVADVLVIDGDPLANIEDTRKVETVVRGGRVFKPSELLAQIETAEG
jgi:imidazolonepropionase-like amidohydrolase